MIGDFATITLTDHRGRTLCKLIKENPDSNWLVGDKPTSKSFQRMMQKRERGLKTRKRDLTTNHLVRLPDGRHRLNVPGPLIPWEKLPPILDRLHAEYGDMRLTVNELHACID